MKIFSSFAISGSGMTAEKLRLDVTAANIANMETTRTAAGGPYRKRTVVFAEILRQAGQAAGGVEARSIIPNQTTRLEYDPEHPDAGLDGYVAYPNIEMDREMAAMITSLRGYEANVTALNTAKSLYLKALEIGRG